LEQGARFISQGSPAGISDKAREVVAKIGSGAGVTLYGAMVPKETPPANVLSLAKAAKPFGSYPHHNLAPEDCVQTHPNIPCISKRFL